MKFSKTSDVVDAYKNYGVLIAKINEFFEHCKCRHGLQQFRHYFGEHLFVGENIDVAALSDYEITIPIELLLEGANEEEIGKWCKETIKIVNEEDGFDRLWSIRTEGGW